MSHQDWEEVKRLAADFQRAQLTSASQRLTERNCVEIINKLIELKLLDVFFTSDGKEYVTPQQLQKEILDELFVLGGRCSLSSLSQTLNIPLQSVETTANVLQSKSVHLIMQQLITNTYLDNITQDLTEKLNQEGFINLNEVSKVYDLPGEFVLEQIGRRIGKFGKIEDGFVFTEGYVRRGLARVRGVLSGVSRPVSCMNLITKCGISDDLFFAHLGKLLTTSRIKGIVGGHSRSAYFIPSSYTKKQNDWVEGFMSGNGYVDLDAAKRMGISDVKGFISGKFSDAVFLDSICLGGGILRQVKDQLEETLKSPGFLDISQTLPMALTEKDIKILLQVVLSSVNNCQVFGAIIVNSDLIKTARESFNSSLNEKAAKEVSSGRYVQYLNENKAKEKKMVEEDARGNKKDDRRKKAAGGKAGGGTQGRETKTKSTKKKYMKKDDWSESEEETVVATKTIKLEFMQSKDIERELKKLEVLSDAASEMISGISTHLQRPLQDDYDKSLKAAYEKHMNEKCGKKSQDELLEKLFKMNAFLELYIEGLDTFDADIKTQLEKYLLRSFCLEINSATEEFLLLENLTSETKNLPRGVQEGLQSLAKATVATYQPILKQLLPPEKKSSKTSNSKENVMKEALNSLLEEFKSTGDHAMFLHLACLIIFAKHTHTLLQASGKFVPMIINFLDGRIDVVLLRTYQENVVGYIKSKNMDENCLKILRELQPKLLELVEGIFAK